MRRTARQLGRSKGLWTLLACLALLVNVATPPGFMVAAGTAGPDIVICTGHGPATLAGQVGDPAHRSGKSGHDGACAFAGHGLASAPPALASIAIAALAPATLSPTARPDLAPGRGLAAPPPPSRAPPVLI